MTFVPDYAFFSTIPKDPGVYIMKDAGGEVIYVGKAKNLRTRVRQYFRSGGDTRFFVAAGLLARTLHSVETIVVDNEKEALLLENHLIKKHQPKYNVNLRDDKQYLVLRIAKQSDYPRLEVVRNIAQDNASYFGPYHSATSCRQTLRTVNRHFQLRTCSDHVLATRKRPCLQYQIERCPAPCMFDVPKQKYAEQVEDVMLFLDGKDKQLKKRLQDRMKIASEKEEFEKAARIRDSIFAVDKTTSKQRIVQDTFIDQDVLGLFRQDNTVFISVLHVRKGKVVGHRPFTLQNQLFDDGMVTSAFIQQYYATGTFIPNEVLTPARSEDIALLSTWLSKNNKTPVKILFPQRGPRHKLVTLANKNAAATAVSKNGIQDNKQILAALTKRLRLRKTPDRIECFDIAHMQGSYTVASCVVFTQGKPNKTLYKKYKVQSVTNDDFAAMHEILSRRFRRAIDAAEQNVQDDANKQHGDKKEQIAWAMPDLIVIDGGKGQLRSAQTAWTDMGFALDSPRAPEIVSLAKPKPGGHKFDRVFVGLAKDSLAIPPNSPELKLLSRLRDEAHRFANTFHRKQRKKDTLRSELGDIPGVGPKTQTALLRHFGSISNIRTANVEQIASVKGVSDTLAQKILQAITK